MISLDPERSVALTTANRGKAVRLGLVLLHAFASGDLSRCFEVGCALQQSHPTQLRGIAAVGMLLASIDAARSGLEGAWLRFDAVLAASRGRCSQHEDAVDLLGVFRSVELGVATPSDLEAQLHDAFRGRPSLPWTAALIGGLLYRWLPIVAPQELRTCIRVHARSASALDSVLLPRTFSALADWEGTVPADATLLLAYQPRAPWAVSYTHLTLPKKRIV